MNQPEMPVKPQPPSKTINRKSEVARFDCFPCVLKNDLPAGLTLELEYDDDDYYAECDPSIVAYVEETVENPNYEEEARKFDRDYANYCDAMELYKIAIKNWKKDERNRKDLIKANKNRIKQLQDEIEQLKKQDA